METPPYFQNLFQKYLDNRCSPAEVDELLAYLKTGGFDELYAAQAADLGSKTFPDDPALRARLEERLKRILAAQPGSVRRMFPWKRVAVAVAVVVAITFGAYFLVFNHTKKQQETVPLVVRTDIKAPAINRATITLAGGQKIFLDSAAGGTLAKQNNVDIIKLGDGQIAYQGAAAETVYNVLSNPRGSKVIDVTLADGSRVWLNAESSLRYPAAFAGKERNVELTGEAYFEIAKNATMPFHVKVKDIQVEVLGTHFNVMAYPDEKTINTTLLEGSVKIKKGNSNKLLKPGEQAVVMPNGDVQVKTDVDLEETLAWKNGFFQFNRAGTEAIMKQVARWYDVEVGYEGKITARSFSGIVNRSSNVSEVMKIMERAGIRFRVEGKKIILTE